MKSPAYLCMLCVWICIPTASAQNWRTPNPNAPNGYNASMAQYHFHGSYKEPAQQQNGYHASEARSKAGMSAFTPPSSSSERRGGGGESSRWGGGESSRWGRGESSRWGGGGATSNGYQNSGQFQKRPEEWNDFYRRRFEATESGGYGGTSANEMNNGQVGWTGAAPVSQGGHSEGYAPPSQGFGSGQLAGAAVGIGAVRRMLQSENANSRTFNRTYNSSSGGFNRIYTGE